MIPFTYVNSRTSKHWHCGEETHRMEGDIFRRNCGGEESACGLRILTLLAQSTTRIRGRLRTVIL